jgi:hypothetical protein
MFFGIVIYMYYDDHPPPHFHAQYDGNDCMFSLDGELIKGAMPPRALKLVKEWTELNQDELHKNWERSVSDMPLNWIKPLR